jgi:hypothetical protein
MTWRSVVGHLAVTFDLAKGHRDGRLCNVVQRRRERSDAHQPATLPVGRMRSFLGGRLVVHRLDCHRQRVVQIPGTRMRVRISVVMPMAVDADMLDRRIQMHANDSGIGQAGTDGTRTGQRERQCRRQHAKQIAQGNDPSRSQPPQSGQTHKHSRLNLTLSFRSPEHSCEPLFRQGKSIFTRSCGHSGPYRWSRARIKQQRSKV